MEESTSCRDGMKTFLLPLIVVIVLTGCSPHLIHKEFDESLDAYNEALRWHDWDTAYLYAADAMREAFKERVASAKNVRLVDFRILSRTYNAEKHEAVVEVESDYYNVFSQAVKTLRDKQKWAYLEEKGTKRWKVVSPLPEFR